MNDDEDFGRRFLFRYIFGTLAFGAAIIGLIKAASLIAGLEMD